MFKYKRLPKDEEVKLSINSIDKGHHEVTYNGVKAIKCPFDYVIYQMILHEVMPDLVIEIGTNIGGGTLYIADMLNNIGHGIIHTIDINDLADPKVRMHERITIFSDGWENYDLEITRKFEKILIIEDSSHTYKNTLNVLNKFHPIVSKDSYFVVEDGIVNALGWEKEFEGGPLRAIREFLPKNTNYTVDRKWCDMFGKNATFNVNGYLKKVN
ncbi:MAG: CmcI family methyltransferase [Algibacter sp.]